MVKIGMLSAGLLVLVLASPVQAQPGCDRACLEGHVSTFLEALYANTPEAVGLAAGARISNNNSLVRLQEAFWDGAVETAYRWDIANPRLGDVATEVVIRNSDDSYTMAVGQSEVRQAPRMPWPCLRRDRDDPCFGAPQSPVVAEAR